MSLRRRYIDASQAFNIRISGEEARIVCVESLRRSTKLETPSQPNRQQQALSLHLYLVLYSNLISCHGRLGLWQMQLSLSFQRMKSEVVSCGNRWLLVLCFIVNFGFIRVSDDWFNFQLLPDVGGPHPQEISRLAVRCFQFVLGMLEAPACRLVFTL